MPETTGLLIVYAKCNKPAEEAAWGDWYDDVHLPDLFRDDPAPTVATRWELSRKPEPGMPGIGFSHVTIYEFAGDDVPSQVDALIAREAALRAEGRIHAAHTVIDAQTYLAHGPWSRKPAPSSDLRGHILAAVLANDPTREAEWDEWYDSQHVPDMLDSDAFAAATRWRREPPAPFGPNHITLYDVTLPSVDEAVALSAAVMPGLIAAGRKHPVHTGAMTVTLVPSGRHGGAGYRPAAR